MSFAARMLDPLACTMHPVPGVPSSGVVGPRVGTVRICFQVAVREGDAVMCAGGQGAILRGEPTVRIEGRPAARMRDPISHQSDPVTHLGIPCGVIQIGCPTVRIGVMAQAQPLLAGARAGTPFCQECEDRAFRPPITEATAAQAEALRRAARDGTPLCEQCEKGKGS